MHRVTELRQDIRLILEEWGCSNIVFGRDGTTHQTATFLYRDQSFKFHFPATINMNGRGRKNYHAQLRRLLRNATPFEDLVALKQAKVALKQGKVAQKERQVLHIRQSQSMGETKPSPRHDTRDLDIWHAIKNGESPKLLSMMHNITEHRAIQIFHQINKERREQC